MAPFLIKPYNRPVGRGKQANRAFGPMEMHPYPRLRRYFPRRGKSALRLPSSFISCTKDSAAKISPSGGDAAEGGRRGAFPRAPARLYGFSAATATSTNCPKCPAPIKWDFAVMAQEEYDAKIPCRFPLFPLKYGKI